MIFVVISSLQTLIMRIIILLLLICTACTNHRAEPKAFVLPQILSIAAPAIPVAVTDYTGLQFPGRSEERRVGKECITTPASGRSMMKKNYLFLLLLTSMMMAMWIMAYL